LSGGGGVFGSIDYTWWDAVKARTVPGRDLRVNVC